MPDVIIEDNARLWTALNKYGRHTRGCGYYTASASSTGVIQWGPCTCGLDKQINPARYKDTP